MLTARRALRVTAMVAVVALAYVGGVVTGVVGSDNPPQKKRGVILTAAQHEEIEDFRGVIDQAADRIVDKAARPVDRDALERAAVEGMLRALGDRWSTYYGRSEFSSFQAALQGRYSGVGLWLRGASRPAIATARSPSS